MQFLWLGKTTERRLEAVESSKRYPLEKSELGASLLDLKSIFCVLKTPTYDFSHGLFHILLERFSKWSPGTAGGQYGGLLL